MPSFSRVDDCCVVEKAGYLFQGGFARDQSDKAVFDLLAADPLARLQVGTG
jgi:hypothetical protein